MALDIVERTIIAILFCTFAYRMLVASAMVLSIATILVGRVGGFASVLHHYSEAFGRAFRQAH